MFGLNILSSLKSKNTDDEYIPMSSLIEEGSIFDRRRIRKERRLHIERRKLLGSYISEEERRFVKNRRYVSSRRNDDQQSVEVIENIDDLKLTTMNVKGLIREQILFIESMGELSLSVKEMESQEIKDNIINHIEILKNQVRKEQHFLRLYIDQNIKQQVDDKTGKSLSDFNADFNTICGEVLQLLEKYIVVDVKEKNTGFFLLDMKKVRGRLSQCLDSKQNHLYPKYFECS